MSGWGGIDLVGSPATITGRPTQLADAGCDGCEEAGLREPYLTSTGTARATG